MKRLITSRSSIGADDVSIGGLNALERAGCIYIYTSDMKHQQYYRAMNLVISTGKMLYYPGSTNIDECMRQFYRALCGRR